MNSKKGSVVTENKTIGGDITIIHEDEAVLALNKPSGLVVNRSKTAKDKTLQDYLDEYLNLEQPEEGIQGSWQELSPEEIFLRRSGMAHRLDKGTSGILLVAKTAEALKTLMKQFKDREIQKEYLALVHGRVKDPKIEIDAPIGRNPRNRLKKAVVREGKPAKTLIEMVNFKEKYSIVKAKPKTGRTHQIRVHLAALNHPVVGDHLYAPKGTRKEDREKFGRLMLHAGEIEFIHPLSSKKVTLSADIPLEFTKYY